jgi:hypothetical protein
MTPDTLAPVASRRPEWLVALLIVGGVALILVIGVGAWWWTTQRTLTVDGDISVTGSSSGYTGGPCVTRSGFDDIAAGAQVVVKDAAGKVLATTTLGPGRSTGTACAFGFHTDVPTGSDFYGVELGRRGVVQFTAEQMAAGVHLTVGG